MPSVVSDSSGNYTISVPTGTYDIKVSPSGNSYSSTIALVQSISSDTVLNFILVPTGSVTLSGHAYGPLGEPLKNVTLQLQGDSSSANTTTDNNGAYSMQVLPGLYSISGNCERTNAPDMPNACDFQSSYHALSLNQNTVMDMNFPAKKVIVHVQDSSGNPVSNVGIGLSANPNPTTDILFRGSVHVQAHGNWNNYGYPDLTDSSGNETVWVFSNTFTMTATPPSGSSFSVTSVPNISITTDTTETIILPSPIILSGHIYGPLGNPLVGITLQLQGDSSSANTTTDNNGAYSMQALPGLYSMSGQCDRVNYSDMPDACQLSIYYHGLSLTQNTVLNIPFPAKKISVHLQDALGNSVSNVAIDTSHPTSSYTISNGVQVNVTNGWNNYGTTTDNSGNENIWLLPQTYNFIATPGSGSIYSQFTLSNVSVTGDQTEIISLQYNHAAPVTTVTLTPVANAQGNYANPTTVSFSATAASGYTIANTYYTVDGGIQQTYSSPLNVSGLGSHTVTYWSVDNTGVTEGVNTKTFTIAVSPTPTPTPVPHTLTKINFAKPWIGLVSTSDAGLKIDLKAEVYDNTTLVTTGIANSVVTGGVGFANAKLDVVSFSTFSPVSIPQGSQMILKLYARNACSGSTKDTGTIRLYYNDSTANSRMSALIDGASHDYFLLTPSLLSRTVGVGPQQTIDTSLGAKCSTFTSIGTWGITL